MKYLRWTLVAQVLFFSAWGLFLLTNYKGATVVWLETVPVDPRDLLSGRYVALSYPIASPKLPECWPLMAKGWGAVYVKLAPSAKTVSTPNGAAALWEVAACSDHDSPNQDEIWAQGTITRGWRGPNLLFGIERFYVTETSDLRNARSGSVVAKVSINRRRGLRILDLVKR